MLDVRQKCPRSKVWPNCYLLLNSVNVSFASFILYLGAWQPCVFNSRTTRNLRVFTKSIICTCFLDTCWIKTKRKPIIHIYSFVKFAIYPISLLNSDFWDSENYSVSAASGVKDMHYSRISSWSYSHKNVICIFVVTSRETI